MNIVEAIVEALENLGGEAHYRDITEYIIKKQLYDFSRTNKPDNTVSKQLQSNSLSTSYGNEDIFYSVHGVEQRKGIWGLVKKHNKITINEFADLENIENPSDIDTEYNEGKEQLKLHKTYERSATLIREAKKLFREKNDRLYCEVCGFDFGKVYGELGEDFIEAHHKKPVSQMKDNDVTKVEDLAMVCSNCHRMIHRKSPYLSIDELKEILNK